MLQGVLWAFFAQGVFLFNVTIAGWWFGTARAQIPTSGGSCRTNLSVTFSIAMSTAVWDSPSMDQNVFHPQWDKLERGNKLTVVVDCLAHTTGLVVGISVPDAKRVRIHGAVDRQIQGCRRLTVFDALVDCCAAAAVDLLLSDESLVIAHAVPSFSSVSPR